MTSHRRLLGLPLACERYLRCAADVRIKLIHVKEILYCRDLAHLISFPREQTARGGMAFQPAHLIV